MYACVHESTEGISGCIIIVQLLNRWPTMCKISCRSIDVFTGEDPVQRLKRIGQSSRLQPETLESRSKSQKTQT